MEVDVLQRANWWGIGRSETRRHRVSLQINPMPIDVKKPVSNFQLPLLPSPKTGSLKFSGTTSRFSAPPRTYRLYRVGPEISVSKAPQNRNGIRHRDSVCVKSFVLLRGFVDRSSEPAFGSRFKKINKKNSAKISMTLLEIWETVWVDRVYFDTFFISEVSESKYTRSFPCADVFPRGNSEVLGRDVLEERVSL